jgi:uncharacterized alpha-E superfamily protein
MSRYLERAEHTARLIDVGLNLMLEQAPEASEQRWSRLLRALHFPDTEFIDAASVTAFMTFDAGTPNSIASCVTLARDNAQRVREQISSEMWEQVNGLYLKIRHSGPDDVWNDRPHDFYNAVKEGSHLFQGITDSTMTQSEGWRFIQVGRLMERATTVASLLDVHYAEVYQGVGRAENADEYLEWVGLLKSLTAFEAYCKVYGAELREDWIAEFLLLNGDFPHSVAFSVARMQAYLHEIASMTETHRAGRIGKLAGRLRALLEFAQMDEIIDDSLHATIQQVETLCGQIHTAIYSTYISYPVEHELAP